MSGFSWVFVRVIFVDNWKLQIDFEGYFHNDGILGQNIKCGCLNIYIVLQTKAFVPIAENKSLDGVAYMFFAGNNLNLYGLNGCSISCFILPMVLIHLGNASC